MFDKVFGRREGPRLPAGRLDEIRELYDAGRWRRALEELEAYPVDALLADAKTLGFWLYLRFNQKSPRPIGPDLQVLVRMTDPDPDHVAAALRLVTPAELEQMIPDLQAQAARASSPEIRDRWREMLPRSTWSADDLDAALRKERITATYDETLEEEPRKKEALEEELLTAGSLVRTSVDLERAILEDPDDDARRLVYSDWLQVQGDPRGELGALQAAGKGAEASAFLRKNAAFFLGEIGAEERPGLALSWRVGHVDSMRVAAHRHGGADHPIGIFAGLPAFRFLRTLTVGLAFEEGNHYVSVVEALCADRGRGRARARCLPRRVVRPAGRGTRGRRPSLRSRRRMMRESVAMVACPGCRSEMSPFEHAGVTLDLCGGCKGLWFDGGELAKVRGHEPPPTVAGGGLELETGGGPSCPRCVTPLVERRVASEGAMKLDACPRCMGVFLARGELQRLRRLATAPSHLTRADLAAFRAAALDRKDRRRAMGETAERIRAFTSQPERASWYDLSGWQSWDSAGPAPMLCFILALPLDENKDFYPRAWVFNFIFVRVLVIAIPAWLYFGFWFTAQSIGMFGGLSAGVNWFAHVGGFVVELIAALRIRVLGSASAKDVRPATTSWGR